MTDVLRAILIAFALITGSMLIGSILYMVIRDAVKRNLNRD